MTTLTLTSDQERKLNMILGSVALDNFMFARRTETPMPQMGRDAMELQELLLKTPSPLKEVV